MMRQLLNVVNQAIQLQLHIHPGLTSQGGTGQATKGVRDITPFPAKGTQAHIT
jgi:hypothetical protein